MKTKNQETQTIYVTIGHPNFPFPMGNRVNAIVWFGDNETPAKVAKKLRKKFAEKPQRHGYDYTQKPFKPSELYYAIFEEKHSEVPSITSLNFPGMDNIVEPFSTRLK